ncbi:hypothetical protein CSC70_06335 [Pseudoxanthomonas kalamensis DSM 18571]|uniref:NlpC/P60 family protein n=1 Tax=Pseudoxanthomonas kalamensis TaxID=289483 RepID=UPI00139199C3|nr:NlpC/P60 family protein [Pseudoxanthomonas kalamensis]KAF1710308.1 hypothetical protein CSC70_06335 [Pseudoxanthomonas kalamensis DSM 18571]
MAHPAEAFVGMVYDEQRFDCADFVAHVRRELHGHEVKLPNGRPRGEHGQVVLGELSKSYAHRTDTPADGDLVLMKRRAGVGHVGLFYRIGGEEWVLHSNETNGASILHRVRELPLWGALIEGYYAWD